MSPREAEIRDNLATRLELIEAGLRLLGTEYVVGNPDGAGGRIDILARDRLDNIVVIELKRSNQAARAALHELMKYVALLQTQRGLPRERLRALLVSTEWHELLTPFSELVHTSPHSLQGYALELDADGVPCRTTETRVLPASKSLTSPREFSWLTFASVEDRTRTTTRILEILKVVCVEHAALLEFSSLDPEQLQFPFSLLLAIFPMSGEEASGVLDQARFPVPLLPDFGPRQELREDDASLQDAVQSSLESRIFCLEGVGDVYCANSEILLAERGNWHLESLRRHGPKLSDTLVLTDGDLIEALCGTEGASETYFLKAAASSSKAQLAALAGPLERLLSRYGWASEAASLLKRASNCADATVVARAYAPTNLVLHFAMFLRTGQVAYLPSFEIVLSTPSHTEQLAGFLAWDGVTRPPDPNTAFPDARPGGNIWRLLADEPTVSGKLMREYGLIFPVLRRENGTRGTDHDYVPIVRWRDEYPERALELSRHLGPIVL